MLTVGIDLAASPARSAVVGIEWGGEGARLTECGRGADDERVLELLSAAQSVGVNAPFGWPEAMVAAIGSYSGEEGWPAPSRAAFRYRSTDVFLNELLSARCEKSYWPMSVAAERTAMRAYRLAGVRERHAAASGSRFARDGSDGVLEVSAIAALMLWELEAEGFRTGDASRRRDACGRLVGSLLGELPYLEVESSRREALAVSEDLLDALVAAFVARAAALGLTTPIPDSDTGAARAEGWTHVPEPGTLGQLLPGAVASAEAEAPSASEVAASRWGLAAAAAGGS